MSLAFNLSTETIIISAITTVFFIAKAYFLGKGDTIGNPSKKKSFAISILYVAILIGTQLIFNFSNAAKLCSYTDSNGKTVTPPQAFGSILLYTLIPNIFILGSVITLITIFPGWLSPFSNTFGYFVVSCLGLKRVFDSMLRTEGNPLIERIYSDQSLIINEMTPANYELFMKTLCKKNGIIRADQVPSCQKTSKPKNMRAKNMRGGNPVASSAQTKVSEHAEMSSPDSIKQNADLSYIDSGRGTKKSSSNVNSVTNDKEIIDRSLFPAYFKLYKLVFWKNTIAEYIWYLLAGSLTLTIGSNAILNMSCKYSSKDLKHIATSHEVERKKITEHDKKTKNSLFEPP